MANEEKFSKTIDDEQLDEVAGGTKAEIKKDIAFLNAIGIKVNENADDTEFDDAWSKVGISCDPNSKGENKYINVGFTEEGWLTKAETVSRQDAMIIAMRNTKKVVDLDDYN